MKIRIYELNKKEVKEVTKKEFDENSLNSSSTYLFDILCSNREEAAKELESLGAEAPKDKKLKNNWLQTILGKSWWIVLRMYGPEQAWIDQTYRPSEIELVK